MEAVTAILKNILKNTTVAIVLGAILGLILGMLIGWVFWPVQWTDGTPEVLREDLQQDYLRMTIDSYNRTGDPAKAIERWNYLGESKDRIYGLVQTDPAYLNPAEVQAFGALVQSVTGAPIQPLTPTGEEPSTAGQTLLLYVSIVVLLILGAVGAFYVFRLLRKNTGPVTAVMQGAEISRQVEKTDFQSLGLAPPITQTMTTYVLGDDLYDESFSIDTGGGEFLGEYGVGVSETIGVGEPKKVAALEIWLFDKNDIKTATKVLMSEHAYNDPNIRARLEPKGELVIVKPQEQVLLETATLQLLATIVDMDYGTGAMPQQSYFERITLELAVWPRSGQ
ncbi:MAG: hypothetical protein EHM33_25105 [Chloroflexi bacterium]|nr:MAG: hypothetical protein EHM33_25105 [Chloroflexota bacterium]